MPWDRCRIRTNCVPVGYTPDLTTSRARKRGNHIHRNWVQELGHLRTESPNYTEYLLLFEECRRFHSSCDRARGLASNPHEKGAFYCGLVVRYRLQLLKTLSR